MGIRSQAKSVFFRLLRQAKHDERLKQGISARDNTLILNLHRVSPDANPFWTPMHPQLFDELLTYLAKSFVITSLEGLNELRPEVPAVVLSFDDGYKDFVEYAMPVMRRHKVKANINVIPMCVESGVPIWNVRLYDFLNRSPRSLIKQIRVPGFEGELEGDGDEEKARFGARLSRFLKMRPRSEREALWPHIEATMDKADDRNGTVMMNAEDVKAASSEHEVGVHSYSHESMAYESEEFFQDDLAKCRVFFAETLRLPLTVYAFPNGSYRSSQVQTLLDGGMKQVLLVDERRARRPARVFPRLTISGSSVDEIVFQSLGYRR